jgi:hypothetical protein
VGRGWYRVGERLRYRTKARTVEGEWVVTWVTRYEDEKDKENPRIWVEWHDNDEFAREYRDWRGVTAATR